MTITATSATNPLTSTAAAAAATSGQLHRHAERVPHAVHGPAAEPGSAQPAERLGHGRAARAVQLGRASRPRPTSSSPALTAAQTSTSSAQLSSLVGRDCNVNAGDFTLDSSGTGVPPVDVSATGAMKGASLVITDANGKEVRTLPIPDGSTAAAIQWDGKDAAGQTVPPGSYHMAVDAGLDGVDHQRELARQRRRGRADLQRTAPAHGRAAVQPGRRHHHRHHRHPAHDDCRSTSMSITDSLYIGISGLEAHGDAISVVGDNIANASTIGFKSARASFADLLGGQLDGTPLGGGVRLARRRPCGRRARSRRPATRSISRSAATACSRWTAATTARPATSTRATVDSSSTTHGYVVNTRRPAPAGLHDRLERGPLADRRRSADRRAPEPAAVATTTANMTLNLDANATPPAAWDPANPTAHVELLDVETVYDSLGDAHKVEVYFRDQGGGNWEWHAMVDGERADRRHARDADRDRLGHAVVQHGGRAASADHHRIERELRRRDREPGDRVQVRRRHRERRHRPGRHHAVQRHVDRDGGRHRRPCVGQPDQRPDQPRRYRRGHLRQRRPSQHRAGRARQLRESRTA